MEETSLPGQSNFFAACGARLREIKAIENELDQCDHGLRAFQKLPRNMQRRAVSSNPQRLPLYLREKHMREVGNNVKKSKRPCRKYRRRPQNLLLEYNRRQRNNVWLETHIWHAKRFHMTQKWGYTLPNTPTAKAFRPSLRAATDTCLIQDVSYECCLEIESPLMEIQNAFTSLLPPPDISRLLDNETTRGMNWLHTTLYKQNRYPFKAIGDTQLLWIRSPSEERAPKLWLWVHPSIYEETLATLIEVFSLEKSNIDEEKTPELLKALDPPTEAKMSIRNVPFERTVAYSSAVSKLIVLKDTLVKFRLVGKKSQDILKRVLQPSDILFDSTKNNLNGETYTDDKNRLWWAEYYSNPLHAKVNDAHLSFWKSLPSSVSNSRRVLGLVIRDPRVVLPPKKASLAYEKEIKSENLTVEREEISLLPILHSAIRDAVTVSITPTHKINTLRANLMVPGSTPPLTKEENRVPVLLLERPGSHVLGLGGGWDLVLPCGWGTQTLVAFVMNGAAVGGQIEEETVIREFLLPPLPHQLPDTNAGKMQAKLQEQKMEEEYFKRPPQCRLNFIKLGTKSPFSCDWMELVNDWNSSYDHFYVLRSQKYLKWLSQKSCKKIDKITQMKSVERDNKRKFPDPDDSPTTKFLKTEDSTVAMDASPVVDPTEMIQELKGALIQVRLVLLEKGNLEPCALICLPTEEDLETYLSQGCLYLAEQARQDLNLTKRKELKEKHRKALVFLQRKRKKAKNDVLCGEKNPLEDHTTMREALDAAVAAVNAEYKDVVADILSYDTRMRQLWLKDPQEEQFQSSIRKIMGYLTHGGFCVRMGRPGGIGYVVSDPLLRYMHRLKLLEQKEETSRGKTSDTPIDSRWKQIFVLVRNPSNLAYKWARLVILNVWH